MKWRVIRGCEARRRKGGRARPWEGEGSGPMRTSQPFGEATRRLKGCSGRPASLVSGQHNYETISVTSCDARV